MSDTFPTRLAETIAALSPTQLIRLREQAPESSGPHALVATASGMRNQSILSDILSGRMPGTKYRARLAELLGVELAWLENDGGEPPDWSLTPLQAWKRFEERLRKQSGSFEEDISVHPSVQARRRTTIAIYAAAYGLDSRSPYPKALVDGRYAELPFALVMRHARRCGMAEPTHPDHLADGHALWAHMRAEIEREVAAAKDRLRRYLPPPRMFEQLRVAVLAQQNSMNREATADLLEVLWRQLHYRESHPRTSVPPRFQEDVGRPHWSRLDDIHQRWA